MPFHYARWQRARPMSTLPALQPPKPRQWVPISSGISQPRCDRPDVSQASDSSFSIMTYNTLCKNYTSLRTYWYTNSHQLLWQFRFDRLKKEIAGYSPHVICLQEVEIRGFYNEWSPFFERLGYQGVFNAKLPSANDRRMAPDKLDGCALFFKTDIFELVECKKITYSQVENLTGPKGLLDKFLTKNNVAVVAVLKHVASGRTVVVADTHLFWDPRYSDVKAKQASVLLDEVQRILTDLQSDNINSIPLVICGDTNSVPQTAVNQLFCTGSCMGHLDMGLYPGFTHPLHLNSAYDSIGGLPFTNFKPDFRATIDHIYYSRDCLAVKGLLDEVDPLYVAKVKGFPTEYIPSDHIPLLAELEFTR